MASFSFHYNNKETKNLLGRVALVALVIATFGLLAFFGLIGLAILFSILMPLHYILRYFGRKGFYAREGNAHVWTTEGAFDRR